MGYPIGEYMGLSVLAEQREHLFSLGLKEAYGRKVVVNLPQVCLHVM